MEEGFQHVLSQQSHVVQLEIHLRSIFLMLEGKWLGTYKPLSYCWKESNSHFSIKEQHGFWKGLLPSLYLQSEELLDFTLQFGSQHLSRSSVLTPGKLRQFLAVFSLHTRTCTARQHCRTVFLPFKQFFPCSKTRDTALPTENLEKNPTSTPQPIPEPFVSLLPLKKNKLTTHNLPETADRRAKSTV